MSVHPTLPALLESFFRNRLAKQRNASRSTIASYRDALRMLILFATEHTGRKPCVVFPARRNEQSRIARHHAACSRHSRQEAAH